MKTYLLWETGYFTVSQSDGYRVPGYVIVQSKSDRTAVAELSAAESADLMKCIADAEAVVRELIKPERIYVLKFGEVNPRVHFHIFPRTKRVGEAYSAEAPDKPPYNGAQLVAWVWKNHASLGFTDEQIAAFVEKAKSLRGSSR